MSMSKDIMAVLRDALGDELLDQINVVCRVVAEEEPLPILASDRFRALNRLRRPTKAILSHDGGFEGLLQSFAGLGDGWVWVLGQLAAEDDTSVGNCVSLLRQTTSQDMAQAVFTVAYCVKDRHPELFARELASQLGHSWRSTGLLVASHLLDTRDTMLLGPLNDYLDKVNAANAPPDLRASKRQVAAALRSAISKIEGRPQKKWWQFWRR